jgi:hypothetical protein
VRRVYRGECLTGWAEEWVAWDGVLGCAEEMSVSVMVGEWFPEVSRAAKRAQESRIGWMGLASLGLGGSGGWWMS